MNNPKIQKTIGLIVVILVIILGVYLILKDKKVNTPIDTTNIEVKDDIDNGIDPVNKDILIPNTTNSQTNPNTTLSNLTKEQKDLLVQLQKSADARDFESFSNSLLEVYKNQWGEVNDFKKVESEFYMYAYNTYFEKGDLENSLKFSTIVYKKVPEAWRFRYLRVLTLEKYGRNAYSTGDLTTAEGYAMQILQMTFRPEGVDLLVDVYISKINTNIKDGNTELAKQNLGFIWDYEVSGDKRAILEQLKIQIEK